VWCVMRGVVCEMWSEAWSVKCGVRDDEDEEDEDKEEDNLILVAVDHEHSNGSVSISNYYNTNSRNNIMGIPMPVPMSMIHSFFLQGTVYTEALDCLDPCNPCFCVLTTDFPLRDGTEDVSERSE
jgi:hypothetical protein